MTNPGHTAAILADANSGNFAYKRRNCRIEQNKRPAAGQCAEPDNRGLGTDPNRNYGGFWGGPGASSDPAVDTFRGSAPFSEPEVQNVRQIVSSRQVTTLITNHTFSNLVLRPPGVAAEGKSPDEVVYKALGDAMAAANGYASQYGYELYDTTGTTEDWSYYAVGRPRLHLRDRAERVPPALRAGRGRVRGQPVARRWTASRSTATRRAATARPT